MPSSAWWSPPVVYLNNFNGQRVELSMEQNGLIELRKHGLEDLLNDLHYAMQEFFELPLSEREAVSKANSPHFMGWERTGSERTQGRIDFREQIDFMTENEYVQYFLPLHSPSIQHLEGYNQWPAESAIPGFRYLIEEYMYEAGQLCRTLLVALLDRYYGYGNNTPRIRSLLDESNEHSLLKLISYPASPEGEFGVNAHKDFGFLTLVPSFGVPGFQAAAIYDTCFWRSVKVEQYSFIVNVGEILQALTGGFYRAIDHRVKTPTPRLSSAFFYGPSLDFELQPFATDNGTRASRLRSGFMATRTQIEAGVTGTDVADAPKTYGDMLWRYYERSYPELMKRHYG